MNDRIEQIKKQFTILDTADRLGFQVRETGNTQAIPCFAHEDNHPSLVLLPDVNRFKCQSCSESGDIIDLVSKVRKINTTEALNFFLSKETNTPAKVNTENYLASRGITQETASRFKLWIGNGAVCIPLPNNGAKYRAINPDEKGQRYWHKPGTTASLFKTMENEKNKRVILVEGEFDAMIVWQETGFMTWTTTTGKATDFKKFIADFKGFEKIYIAYDNDKAGNEGALQVAETLGRDRCFRIKPDNAKDWTDYFISGKEKEDFVQILKSASPYSKSIMQEYMQGLAESGFRITSGFDLIDTALGGFRSSNTYVIAGLEKSGKSSFLMNMLDKMFISGHKAAYINTELSVNEFIYRMAAIHNEVTIVEAETNTDLGKQWLSTVSEQLFYAGVTDISEKNQISFRKTMEQIDEFVRQGVKIVMIDNLTTFSTQGGSGKQGWEVLAQSISTIVNYAKEKNIVVFCVIHTRHGVVFSETSSGIKDMVTKGEFDKIFDESITAVRKPTLADVFGGGAALSQISGTIFVWRPFQKFASSIFNKQTGIVVDSFRHAQSGQLFRLDFDGAKGLFIEHGWDAPFIQDNPLPPPEQENMPF